MGVYLYSLGKTGKIKADVDHGSRTIFQMKYRWKYYFSAYGKYAKKEDRVVERAHANAVKAAQDPDFNGLVYVGDKPYDGQDIYLLDEKRLTWDDCNKFPGLVVGRFKKNGRKWSVVAPHECPNQREVMNFWETKDLITNEQIYSHVKDEHGNPDLYVVANFDQGKFVSGYSHPKGSLDQSKVVKLSENSKLVDLATKTVSLRRTDGKSVVYLFPHEGAIIRGNSCHRVNESGAS